MKIIIILSTMAACAALAPHANIGRMSFPSSHQLNINSIQPQSGCNFTRLGKIKKSMTLSPSEISANPVINEGAAMNILQFILFITVASLMRLPSISSFTTNALRIFPQRQMLDYEPKCLWWIGSFIIPPWYLIMVYSVGSFDHLQVVVAGVQIQTWLYHVPHHRF